VNRLFISLYLDENVDVRVAEVVRGRKHSALTCREARLLGGSDEVQLEYAAERRLALVTHNRVHFEQLAREYIRIGCGHAGIIVAVRRPYYDNARRLLVLLNQMTADEMDNQLLYI
jgi:hypothetical protein